MPKRPTKRFAGPKKPSPALRKPIVVPRPSDSNPDGPSPDEIQKLITSERMRKLPLVYDFFDIPESDDDAVLRLVFVLLPRVFRGSDEVYDDYNGPGRKPKWLNGGDVELFHAAQELEGSYCSRDDALNKINQKWKLGLKLSTLRKHYSNGQRKYVQMVLAAQKLPQFARFLGISFPDS